MAALPRYPSHFLNPATITNVRENLDGYVNILPEKETPIRDRIARKAGSGLAASWNVMTAFGSGNAPFAEGGTPNEDTTTYARRSAVYKELGKKKSISDKMIAAGMSFTDIEAQETEVAMRETIQEQVNISNYEVRQRNRCWWKKVFLRRHIQPIQHFRSLHDPHGQRPLCWAQDD